MWVNSGESGAFAEPSRRLWLFAALSALVGLLMVAGFAWAQEQRIVVLVNDDPVSAYDIEQRERFLAVTTQQKPSPALKKEATDLLIEERLQVQEARKLSVTADEADVTTILEGMAKKNNMSVDGLLSALAQMGVNSKTLKDRIRSQIVWQDVVRRKFRSDVLIGEAEIDEELAESQDGDGDDGDTASAPRSAALQLRQVTFAVARGSDQKTIAERLAQAEALRARFSFNSCANVSELAKGFKGASVKSLPDQAISAVAQPARALLIYAKVGQMTPPVISASGVDVYAVCGKRSQPDDPERMEAKNKIMQQEMSLRSERLLRDLRQDAFIEYR